MSANDQSQHTYMTMICDRPFVDALHSVMSRLFTSSSYNYIDIHSSSFITQRKLLIGVNVLEKGETTVGGVFVYLCVCDDNCLFCPKL